MDPTRLANRTLEALERMPPDKRSRAQAIIERTQTPEARAKDAADRAILDREYRETGRIATVGERINSQDAVLFRHFIETLRLERIARGLSLEELALRSCIDKGALSRLEGGRQSNPTIATLWRYARALGMRLNLSLEPWPDNSAITRDRGPSSPVKDQETIAPT